MEIAGKKALILGAGISGLSSLQLLKKLGAKITIFDEKMQLSPEEFREKNALGGEIDIVFQTMEDSQLKDFDFAVISPGIPLHSAFAKRVQDKKIPLLGEIELSYLQEKGSIYTITGTNGKTTTTALTGEIFSNYFDKVFVVGNIGIPYSEKVLETDNTSKTVCEISSYQLETMHTVHPKVSAILNITPDHIDRHGNFENYAATKLLITKNQTKEDFCVLNYDNPLLREAAESIPSQVLFFSRMKELESGVFLKGDTIYYSGVAGSEEVCKVSQLQIIGNHNYENVMAAVAISIAAGIPLSEIAKSVMNFKGVPHRIEYVKESKGVIFYNDSKGTNTDAAIKALESMERPVVLIGGGYDKQADYSDWIKAFEGKVKCLILLGATKYKIQEEAEKQGFTNIILVDSLEEAVEESVKNSIKGDAVLLSPACASWGMFKSFEERGDQFKQLVRKLGD